MLQAIDKPLSSPRDSNQRAIEIWQAYRVARLPMRVAREAGSASEFVVTPIIDPNFWMGSFNSVGDALCFCDQTGLPVQNEAQARAVEQAAGDAELARALQALPVVRAAL